MMDLSINGTSDDDGCGDGCDGSTMEEEDEKRAAAAAAADNHRSIAKLGDIPE